MQRPRVERRFIAPLALLLIGAFLQPASALERRAIPAPDDVGDEWGASATVTIRYYNNCTGWIWVYSGWTKGEQVGVRFDTGCPPLTSLLQQSWALTFTGIPAGYGFTGTIAVVSDDDCTGQPLAAQPWIPLSGWATHAWNVVVPSSFLLEITWGSVRGFTNQTALVLDHPGAGPTGPAACGFCFPADRVTHTKYYGINGSSCPGVPFNDGTCDLEAMIYVQLACTTDVESTSWGKVKGLYR